MFAPSLFYCMGTSTKEAKSYQDCNFAKWIKEMKGSKEVKGICIPEAWIRVVAIEIEKDYEIP